MNDETDRFNEVKRLDQEDDYDTPSLVNPLPAERPIGAQHVAVKRKTSAVLAEIKALAAAAGDAWYYRWPVKSSGDDSKKWIEGPSIKLANDLARVYGNCDVDVRVVENNESWFFYARFMDLETGFSMTRPFQQRKNQKSIRGDGDRQRDIAFQIGASKAIRNVICNALQTYADYGFEEARNSLIDKIGKNLEGSRERLGQLISERKIEFERVERVVGRTVKDMLAPDIARVLAMLKAIDDGMASVNETFPYQAEQVNPLANDPPAGITGTQGDVDHARVAAGARQEPETPEPPKVGRPRKPRQEPSAPIQEAEKRDPQPAPYVAPVPTSSPPPPVTRTASPVAAPAPPAPPAPVTRIAAPPPPQPLQTPQAHKIQLHTGEVVEMSAEEVAWGKQQGWDIVQTAKHFLEQDKAAQIGMAEPHTEGAEDAFRQEKREREEQEARESAAARPIQASTSVTAGGGQVADAGGIPGFLDRSGFVAEATSHIGQFKGSAGSLLDWWRTKAKDRAKLALEDQTRLSQLYTAKFNSLNSENPL